MTDFYSRYVPDWVVDDTFAALDRIRRALELPAEVSPIRVAREVEYLVERKTSAPR